jgi:hypothetical protein
MINANFGNSDTKLYRMELLQKKSTSKRDCSQNIRCIHNTHRCLRNLEDMGERERVDLEDLRDLDYMDVGGGGGAKRLPFQILKKLYV